MLKTISHLGNVKLNPQCVYLLEWAKFKCLTITNVGEVVEGLTLSILLVKKKNKRKMVQPLWKKIRSHLFVFFVYLFEYIHI